MSILAVYPNVIGQSGQIPSIIYIATNNTVDEVLATGFLNPIVDSLGLSLADTMVAVVSTKLTPSARASSSDTYGISFSNGNWSLTQNNSSTFPVVIDSQGNMSGIGSIDARGSILVNNSLAGLSNRIIVENSSPAANSDAAFEVITTCDVTGMSGGSPSIIYLQNGFQFWQSGVWAKGDGGDNNFHITFGNFSNGDPLVLTGDSPRALVNGDLKVVGNTTIENTVSGGPVSLTIQNDSPTTNAAAGISLNTTSNGGGTVGGSPSIFFTQEGYQTWNAGIWSVGDSGDNAFHISSTASFTSTDPVVIGRDNNTTLNGDITVTGNSNITGDCTVTGTLTNMNVPYLANIGLSFGGTGSTVTISVPGMLSSDLVFVNMRALTNPVQLLTTVADNDQFIMTFTGDPGACNFQVAAYRNA